MVNPEINITVLYAVPSVLKNYGGKIEVCTVVVNLS